MEDILLIDKPSGISSYDVIRVLKKKIPDKKIGHAGTLDPQASGLLIVGVGNGTKKLKDLIKLSKTYEAKVRLGIKTNTGDMEGSIIEEKSVDTISKNKVNKIVNELPNKIILPIPIFSAVKVSGTPLYKRARKGEKFTPPTREMEIHRAVLKKLNDNTLTILFEVGSGTYIRSLAEEIGNRLGYPATLYSLRRTSIGEYSIDNAVKLDSIS